MLFTIIQKCIVARHTHGPNWNCSKKVWLHILQWQ